MSQLALKCDKFNLSHGLHDLLESGELVDVTLACQGQFIQAHKTVLAACSPHFRDIFKLQAWQHPVVFLQDAEVAKVQALVDFMYNGEVTVNEADLVGLLKLADALKVSGLASQEKTCDHSVVLDKTLLTSPHQATPPLAKIARRSVNSDAYKSGALPVLEALLTSAQSPPQVEQQVGQSAPDLSWPQPTEESFTVPLTQTCAVYMNDSIKVEVEELADPLGGMLQDEVDEKDTHHTDQRQDDAWNEAGPSSHDPGTSTQSQPAPHASTSWQGTGSDASMASSYGRDCKPHQVDLQPQNSNMREVNDEENSQHYCLDWNEEATSLQSHDDDNKTIFNCDVCPKVYKNRTDLNSHYRNIHPTVMRFSCILCGAKFSNIRDEQQHRISEHGDDFYPFACSECSKRFRKNTTLKHHLKIKHGKDIEIKLGKNRNCGFCFQKFDKMHLKEEHIRMCHPEFIFKCRFCPRTFYSRNDRQKHEINVHRENVDNPEQFFACTLCDTAVTSQYGLQRHMSVAHKT